MINPLAYVFEKYKKYIEPKLKMTREKIDKNTNEMIMYNMFFSALRSCGLELVATESFPDHHVYAESDLQFLLDLAHANGAQLVTTVKDGQRLPQRFRQAVSCGR